MVQEQLIKRGIKDKKVLETMNKIPRHLFVEEALRYRAYGDHPLPISEGQTISQPYMVALMTESLKLTGKERVLEIGTGSGYQTAVLAEMSKKVYTIERIKSIAVKARERLDALGYINIVTKTFDGTYGWMSESPFDRIIVTAYSPDISEILLKQLTVSGIMIIPAGSENIQTLFKVTKTENGIEKEEVTACVFVRLIGEYGWKEDKTVCRKFL